MLTLAAGLAACGEPDAAAPVPSVPATSSQVTGPTTPTGPTTVGDRSGDGSDRESTEAGTAITAIEQPAQSTTQAERVDAPLRVEWIGGSDVEWLEVSLPQAFLATVSSVEGRPLDVRTRLRQGALAPDVREMIGEALANRAASLIVSFNPVWLHFDEGTCDHLTVPRERYACLLTPVSDAVTAARDREIEALFDALVDAGVPAYVYMQPHSSDVLADPAVEPLIAAAEQRLASFDPNVPDVRVVARSFTRDLPPLREGVDFHDMVHPLPTGAAVLGQWIATDVAAFWSARGFGR